MSAATRMALKRFVKAILAAAAAAAITTGIDHLSELEGALPPVVMALLTALLLAGQKWLKEAARGH